MKKDEYTNLSNFLNKIKEGKEKIALRKLIQMQRDFV